MELTNILGRIKSEHVPPKPFLALELTMDVVTAAVWHVEDGVTQIITLGPPVEWVEDSSKSGDNLVQAVDSTISTAIDGLLVEPNQVVFGLPESWITPRAIDEKKLKLIKLISRELELKPLGFVAVTDSLLRYLKMQEGTPSTSLLIQVAHDDITVRHVVHGKVLGSKTVGRSDDIALDVEEGISQLNIVGNLPSRIIVFDGKTDLEEVVQNLVSYDWQSKFQFLHLPKVESLSSDIIIRSIAVAGGAEVAKSIGFEITEPEPSQSAPAHSPIEPTESTDKTETPTTSAFGFSDIPFSPPTDKTETPTNRHADTPTPPIEPTQPKLKFKLPSLPLLNFRLPRLKLGNKLIIITSLTLLVVASSLAALWFVPHAVVTIYVKPKVLDENIPITLSTLATTINLDDSIIPSSIIPTTVTGTDTIKTTGTKIVGDSASGEVTIYNRTELVKLFPAGTTLEASGITFTLSDDVTVASSSSGADYINVPGKASVTLTSSSIGESGNLGENTEFAVDDYSFASYVARNESALSGGNSREISVVGQDDLATIFDSLSSKLENEARDKLLSTSAEGSGVYLLEDSFELTGESYSVEVGEEASSLQGTFEVSISAIHYLTTDVEELISTRINRAIPPGYVRTLDLPTVELSSATKESETDVIAEAKVSVSLLPQLSQDNMQTLLRGLSSDEIKSALSGVVGMDSAHVLITPKFLPPRWKIMPRNPDNISIIIKSAN